MVAFTKYKTSFKEQFKKSLSYHKKHILIAIMCFVIAIVGLNIYGSTRAASKSKLDGLQVVAYEMIEDIFDTSSIEDLRKQVSIGVDMDTGDLEIGGQTYNVGALSAVHEMLVTIAISVAIILWFPSLLSTFISGTAYAELIFKRLLFLGVCIFMIYNSAKICSEVVNAGTQVTEKVSDQAVQPTFENKQQILDTIADNMLDYKEDTYKGGPIVKAIKKGIGSLKKMFVLEFGRPIGYILVLLLPKIILSLVLVLSTVFTVSRAVEIIILLTLSPIPFAIVGNDPLGSGAGSRFIKNLFALSLQGAVMILILAVGTQMYQSALATCTTYEALSKNVFQLIAVAFAQATLLMKSLTISQKALGLN